MKKFLLSLIIVVMLSTSISNSVLANSISDEEIVTNFLNTIENEEEFLLMVQLLFLVEDDQGLLETYDALFRDIANSEGSRFDELNVSVLFTIEFVNEYVNSREDYYALENAIKDHNVVTYIATLNNEGIENIFNQLAQAGYGKNDLKNNQLNKLTKLLNKTVSFKNYGITFPIITISDDYVTSTVDYELLDSLASHADRMVNKEGHTNQYETLLVNLVEHYNNFFTEAKTKDRKIMAAYMDKYGLLAMSE